MNVASSTQPKTRIWKKLTVVDVQEISKQFPLRDIARVNTGTPIFTPNLNTNPPSAKDLRDQELANIKQSINNLFKDEAKRVFEHLNTMVKDVGYKSFNLKERLYKEVEALFDENEQLIVNGLQHITENPRVLLTNGFLKYIRYSLPVFVTQEPKVTYNDVFDINDQSRLAARLDNMLPYIGKDKDFENKIVNELAVFHGLGIADDVATIQNLETEIEACKDYLRRQLHPILFQDVKVPLEETTETLEPRQVSLRMFCVNDQEYEHYRAELAKLKPLIGGLSDDPRFKQLVTDFYKAAKHINKVFDNDERIRYTTSRERRRFVSRVMQGEMEKL